MSEMAIFCIGTNHRTTEQENVLVRLYNDCRYEDLGYIDRQGHLVGTGGNYAAPVAGGHKLLVDGQAGAGLTLGDQTRGVVDVIQDRNPTNVRLIGHSRGAILAVLIASKLHESHQGITCQLFLYDPVKRSMKRMSKAGKLNKNVNRVRVLVSEDENNKTCGVKHFRLMNLSNITTSQAAIVRMPGTHGTMTQVTGCPIGKLGYMLAVEWLERLIPSVPMRHHYGVSHTDFLKCYARINQFNSTFMEEGTKMRRVNDLTNGRMSTNVVPVGGFRSEKLARSKPNRFMGSGFIVNEDHFARFQRSYPTLAKQIGGTRPVDLSSYEYRSEYYRYRRIDLQGWTIMKAAGVAPAPAAAALPATR